MKSLRLNTNRPLLAALCGVALLLVAACNGEGKKEEHNLEQDDAGKTATHADVKPAIEAGEPVYFCPMHPEVISGEQGQCDPCGGMKLVEHKGLVYGCPMHPDEVTADIESECRVCGMDLEELKKKEAAEAQTQPAA